MNRPTKGIPFRTIGLKVGTMTGSGGQPRPVDDAWGLEQAGAVHRAFLEVTRTSPAF